LRRCSGVSHRYVGLLTLVALLLVLHPRLVSVLYHDLGMIELARGLVSDRQNPVLRMASAERYLSRSVAWYPDNIQASRGLARVELAEGNFFAASVLLSRSIESSPDHTMVHYYLGNAYAGLGRRADAVREWIVAGAEPTMFGERALEEGRYADAAAEYALVVQLHPNCAQGYVGLGRAYAYQSRWDQAIPAFERALAIDAEDAEALTELGRAYYVGQDDIDTATSLIQRAIEVDPNLWSMLVMADLYQSRGDLPSARDWYERAASFAPDALLPKKKLGAVLVSLGQLSEAIDVLSDVVMRDAEDAQAHWLLAEAYFRAGMGEQACLEYSRGIQLDQGKAVNQAVMCGLESLCNKQQGR
jgi:tetratricopeptide (TPR) repeat protein